MRGTVTIKNTSFRFSGAPARIGLVVLCFLAAGTVVGQDHAMHQMKSMSADSMAVAWRMPPMDMSMPMMPGIHGKVPTVGPFLPGMGMDAMMFPEAVPNEVLDLADGDTITVTASLVRRTINGKQFVMYGYNGQYPGPLLRVQRGATVVVHFRNEIEMPSTVHWHGLRHDNRFDGVPGVTQDAVEVGETFTYEVRFPDTGLYWYHPHVREDLQQDLGLYGNMLVDPLTSGYYAPVNREEVMILDDVLMDDQGLIPFGKESPSNVLMGRFGNVMLVNGDDDYRIEARRGEVVRFYLTNVANSRTFNVVFGGQRTKIVASDVGKFQREEWVGSVPIGPAERYIADVSFDEPGVVAITNTIQAVNHFRGEFYPHVDTLAVVTVSEEPAAPDHSASFQVLRENDDVTNDIESFRPHFDRTPDHELDLTLHVDGLPIAIMRMMEIDTLYVPPMEWNDAMPMMNWLASGNEVTWVIRDRATGKENMEIQWDFRVGDVVKVRIFNDPKSFHPMNHPVHVHGQRFLVLAMDGVRNTNMVWKDTAIVPVGSTMDILIDVTNPGEWMLHCHIAEHLHAGMMMGFSVSDESASGSD